MRKDRVEGEEEREGEGSKGKLSMKPALPNEVVVHVERNVWRRE